MDHPHVFAWPTICCTCGVEAPTAFHLVAGHARLRNALYDVGFVTEPSVHVYFVLKDKTSLIVQGSQPYSTFAPSVGGTARCWERVEYSANERDRYGQAGRLSPASR